MRELALGVDFLPRYGGLPKDVQKKVAALVDKFRDHTGAGVNLEKPNAAADDRARTVRVDRFWRGVVAAPTAGSTYVLLDVLPHDDAYAWCERHVLDVNPATGALEIQDVEALEAFRAQTGPSPDQTPAGLFSTVPDKHFTQLGVPDPVVVLARALGTETELEALATVLPPAQGDALRGLALGMSPEVIYRELVADEPPGDVDTDDLDTAVRRPASSGMFYVVGSAAELEGLLNRPFDTWRVFLHPTQRRLAYRERFNGPTKVSGGAGTGKTVVALHRARFLAERAAPDERILFTTFTRALAASIQRSLELLGGKDLADRVEVSTVDALAYRVVRDAEGAAPRVLTDDEQDTHWAQVATDAVAPALARSEYERVILAQDVRDRATYFTARRAGQGVPLNRRGRAQAWAVVEAFERSLAEQGLRTFRQLVRDAERHLASQGPRYRHVIVDEAQDLHAGQWRLLRAAVPPAPNDLILVGDVHQRIYDDRVSLRAVGVDVVGRSFNLRLNYRTTEEILRWAVGLLTGESFDDLDDAPAALAGYRSALHGPPPDLAGYTSRDAELRALGTTVRGWIEEGVAPSAIGVAARTRKVCEQATDALAQAGLPVRALGRDDDADAVSIGTMHRMKGLEFRCVAAVGVEDGSVPSPHAVTRRDEDEPRHRQDLQRERCLLFVACTRARDALRVSWTGEPSPFLPGTR